MNIKMKLNELQNQAEAHRKSEMEALNQARDSLVDIQNGASKLKFTDANLEKLAKDHKARLQKAEAVVNNSKIQKYKRTHETPLKQDFVTELPPEISPLQKPERLQKPTAIVRVLPHCPTTLNQPSSY